MTPCQSAGRKKIARIYDNKESPQGKINLTCHLIIYRATKGELEYE